MAVHPLRPATDRRLGRPLPHQLANQTQAILKAPGPKVPSFAPQSICGISLSFPKLSPSLRHIPTRYSPVRHSPPIKYKYLTVLPFDLHVLGMPPAFNLSQDQTLQFIPTACIHRLHYFSYASTQIHYKVSTQFVSIFLIIVACRRGVYSLQITPLCQTLF